MHKRHYLNVLQQNTDNSAPICGLKSINPEKSQTEPPLKHKKAPTFLTFSVKWKQPFVTITHTDQN